MEGRWPELYLVGAARAGTTSLWSYLDQHPQIFMSQVKEPHFFSEDKPSYVPTMSDETSYLRLFAAARPGQLRGEASPSYLPDAVAPYALARARPDARILVILREPIARAYSSYWHKVRYGREPRTFLEAIRADLADDPARSRPPRYTGSYAGYLRPYLELFGDGVLVLFLEELAADPRGELRRTFRFLGVDEDEADRIRLHVLNPTALPGNRLVRRAYASNRLRSIGARVVPNAFRVRLERLLLRQAAVPPIDEEARRLLEAHYAPEAAALERLLGRAVPWAAGGAAGAAGMAAAPEAPDRPATGTGR